MTPWSHDAIIVIIIIILKSGLVVTVESERNTAIM